MLITERGVGKAAHVTAEAVDERFVSTYTGSNWISESSPFYPSKPPAGSRSFSADVIWGADIEEDFMVGTEEILL